MFRFFIVLGLGFLYISERSKRKGLNASVKKICLQLKEISDLSDISEEIRHKIRQLGNDLVSSLDFEDVFSMLREHPTISWTIKK